MNLKKRLIGGLISGMVLLKLDWRKWKQDRNVGKQTQYQPVKQEDTVGCSGAGYLPPAICYVLLRVCRNRQEVYIMLLLLLKSYLCTSNLDCLTP